MSIHYYDSKELIDRLRDGLLAGSRQTVFLVGAPISEPNRPGEPGVPGVDGLIKPAGEVTREDLLSSDAVIAGSPVYFGTMAAELKDMFDKNVVIRNRMEGKIGAAFTTSGDPTGGKETTLMSIIQAMLIYGMVIVGDPMDATGHYGTACVGSPDGKDAENGRKLGCGITFPP